jgi:copper chaperone CopZ
MKGNKMIQTFQVINVKCGGCAATLKEKLFEEFGEVEIDLEKEPREITLNIKEEEIVVLGETLKKLGYPFITEKMGFVDGTSAKAKSFVSCAIGKMNN